MLRLHVPPPTLASEIIGLYALTYLIGLLSQAEKAVSVAALENARLAQAVLQRNRELGALNRLARALNAETDPPTILQLGLDGVVEALALDTARAYQHEEGELRLAAQVGGVHAEHETEERWRRAAARAVALGRTVTTGWSPQPGGAEHLSAGPPSVSIPLVLHGHIGAVVQVDLSRRRPAATDTMLETLDVFCGELAVALENAMLRGAAHRTAILQEKNRIAQELHDTVLQMLFGVGLRLQWSLEQLPAGSALRAPLEEARHLSARAGGELRGAIFTLCSDIAEIGLVPAVESLGGELAVYNNDEQGAALKAAIPLALPASEPV